MGSPQPMESPQNQGVAPATGIAARPGVAPTHHHPRPPNICVDGVPRGIPMLHGPPAPRIRPPRGHVRLSIAPRQGEAARWEDHGARGDGHAPGPIPADRDVHIFACRALLGEDHRRAPPSPAEQAVKQRPTSAPLSVWRVDRMGGSVSSTASARAQVAQGVFVAVGRRRIGSSYLVDAGFGIGESRIMTGSGHGFCAGPETGHAMALAQAKGSAGGIGTSHGIGAGHRAGAGHGTGTCSGIGAGHRINAQA